MPKGKYTLADVQQPQQQGQFTAADIGTSAPQLSPQMQMNRALNASPTQFEIERNPSFQPGFGGRVADVARGFVNNAKETVYKTPLEQVNPRVSAPVDVQTIKHDADVGDTAGIVGDVFPQTVMASLPFLSKGATGAAEGVRKFAMATGDPNVLYHSYLDPVANTPTSIPSAPRPVMRAVLRDMEAAGETQAANRIRSGDATLGDLDTMRQRANRLSRSIYRSPGNYPPGLAEGADNFASAIRDQIYPSIEEAHGLEPGSLRSIKELQGASMEADRNPSFFSRIIQKGVGSGIGAAIGGHFGGPYGSEVGALAGWTAAEPLARAADRGLINLRTRSLASRFPEAVQPPDTGPVYEGDYVGPTDYKPVRGVIEGQQPPTVNRLFFLRGGNQNALPMEGTQNAMVTPPPPDASGPVSNPRVPPFLRNTRAQRLGLLLGEPKAEPTQLPASSEPIPDYPTQPPQRTVFRDPGTGKMKRGYTSGGKKIYQ